MLKCLRRHLLYLEWWCYKTAADAFVALARSAGDALLQIHGYPAEEDAIHRAATPPHARPK